MTAADRISSFLMIAWGIVTLGVAINSAIQLHSITGDRIGVEAWRTFAFVVFAGLFVMLGLYPRRMPGLWELVFFQKAGVPIYLTFYAKPIAAEGSSLTDAGIVPVDTLLALTMFVCYFLARGWRAWASDVA